MHSLIDLSPEVAAALQTRQPVVALESAIISHGLPYPTNLEMAGQVEAIVRAEGAIPATIAVLNGRCRVGLSAAEVALLAGDKGVAKVSLRDLPVILANGRPGATTVAATATIADAAGIPVFVTGGIGGVHRGGHHPSAQMWDVSADLTVLGRVRTAVVCAGAKSVLDIGATLEVLETLGVTVVGYGTDRFPGFYTRSTPYGVDVRVDHAAAAAAIIRARSAAALPGGVLVVNPLPGDAALDEAEVESALQQALSEMAAEGITGKAVTPYLLARLHAVTAGRSLAANLALIASNARVGAQIAVELARAAGFTDRPQPTAVRAWSAPPGVESHPHTCCSSHTG